MLAQMHRMIAFMRMFMRMCLIFYLLLFICQCYSSENVEDLIVVTDLLIRHSRTVFNIIYIVVNFMLQIFGTSWQVITCILSAGVLFVIYLVWSLTKWWPFIENMLFLTLMIRTYLYLSGKMVILK